ncbi:hypothetical protein PHYBOEH_006285 [Phytophthora boehmeriae]|uniref:Uncharacterized protein n=1 Tax=Phytophthora boehmeriae TaxID=109152 RepID=A0A8T1WJY9_9STRA|nr:hypothetical protein PHYBOEH_006285 [Phytophthora boehmeriae]
MRLYHILLASAVALLASSNDIVNAADCEVISYPPEPATGSSYAGSASQTSTTGSNVDASASSASTSASASTTGSYDNTPIQGSNVDASAASTSNSASTSSDMGPGQVDPSPVQQDSDAGSKVEGSAASNPGDNDSPIQQGSAPGAAGSSVDASAGSNPDDENDKWGKDDASPIRRDSDAASNPGDNESPVQQGSAPGSAGSNVDASADFYSDDENNKWGSDDASPIQQDSAPGSYVDASHPDDVASASTWTGVEPDSDPTQKIGLDSTPAPVTSTSRSSSGSAPTDVDAAHDTAQSTAADADSNPTFQITDAPTATTAAPIAASSGSSSAAAPTPASNNSTSTASNGKLCAKPRVRITEIDVGAAIENNEDEVGLKVVAIASLPSGGSRIAFQSGDSVIVRELDANDKLVSSSPAVKVPLHDFGDLHADKDGFVLLGTRDAEGGGTANCGNPSNLCGAAPSSENACYDMYMVRYDGSKESWATKLTSSSSSLPPYSTGKTGEDVYMIWWYAHHGRLAYNGKDWAAYFGAAISTSEGGCINIHQGDRMKVVDPSGAITSDKDSFDWGCSHSGYERITYDTRTKSFAAICKTDNNNRIMPPNNWDATIYPVDLAASNLGDIVQDGDASSKKYWATVSNGQGDNAAVHLIHFGLDGKATEDIKLGGTDANERAPHLASIGEGGMLAMWEGSSSGGDLMEGGDRTIYAQVLDSTSGKAISEKITVDKSVVGNRYQALKSFPDGSVAYLSKGKSGSSLQVVRFFGS